jgi:hypothetical protein
VVSTVVEYFCKKVKLSSSSTILQLDIGDLFDSLRASEWLASQHFGVYILVAVISRLNCHTSNQNSVSFEICKCPCVCVTRSVELSLYIKINVVDLRSEHPTSTLIRCLKIKVVNWKSPISVGIV